MKYIYNPNNKIYKLNFLSLIGQKYADIDIPIIDKPSKMIKNIMYKYDLIDDSSLMLYEYSFKYETLIDFVFDIDNFEDELPQKELKGIQVLTIHKSKGLEFDNVIVLDSRKVNYPADIIFDYDTIFLKDIKVNFENRDKVDKDFEYIYKKYDNLNKEDSKNVEYVAFTRAVNSLFVIKKKKNSRIITDLKEIEIGELIEYQNTSTYQEIDTFNLKLKNYGKQEYKDLEEKEYKPNDYEAIYFGLATHYCFECENFDAVLNRYGEFCDVKSAFELYQKAKKLLPDGKVYKEIPFIYKERVGIIDLMIENDDEVIIIDYKTHTPNDKREYIKQVNRYKEAIENIYLKQTKGYIFYLDTLTLTEI